MRHTQEELQAMIDAEQAPIKKVREIKKITVSTAAGNVFNAHDEARLNMVSAIVASDFLGETEAYWKLADNTLKLITLNELKEAHALSIQTKGKIVLG